MNLPEQSQHTWSGQSPQKESRKTLHLSWDSPQMGPISPIHWAGRGLWQSQVLRSCWSAAVWPHGATPGAQVSHRGGGSDGLFQKPSGLRWPLAGPPEWGGVGVASPSPRGTAPGGRAGSPQTARGTLSQTCFHSFRKAGEAARKGSPQAPLRLGLGWGRGRGLALSLSFLATAQESLSPAILVPPAWQEGGVFLGVVGPATAAMPSPTPRSRGCRPWQAPAEPSSPWCWAEPLVFSCPVTPASCYPAPQAACGAGSVGPSPAFYSQDTEAAVGDVASQTQTRAPRARRSPACSPAPLPGLRPHARSVGQRPAALPARMGPVERPPAGSASQPTPCWSVLVPCHWGLQSLLWPTWAARGHTGIGGGRGGLCGAVVRTPTAASRSPPSLGVPAAGLGQSWPAGLRGLQEGAVRGPLQPQDLLRTPIVCRSGGLPYALCHGLSERCFSSRAGVGWVGREEAAPPDFLRVAYLGGTSDGVSP